ncbi:MAG: hypothetical protein OEM62_08835, partial [Acidobacteriota bacterium]|nr:hypothetical protein [Acidobacteriota bacterium]
VARNVAGDYEWFTRDAATGAGTDANGTGITHGTTNDFLLTGDWDGDGIDDHAVWRPSTGTFIIRRSSAPAPPLEFVHGVSGDYPVANSQVH